MVRLNRRGIPDRTELPGLRHRRSPKDALPALRSDGRTTLCCPRISSGRIMFRHDVGKNGLGVTRANRQKDGEELRMRLCRGFARWALLLPLSVSLVGIPTDRGQADEAAKSESRLERQVFPEDVFPEGAFDSNLVPKDAAETAFSKSKQNLTSRKETRSAKGGFSFDVKTDHDVDIKKFMATDTLEQKFLDDTTSLQPPHAVKKSIPLLGLSLTRPLN